MNQKNRSRTRTLVMSAMIVLLSITGVILSTAEEKDGIDKAVFYVA